MAIQFLNAEEVAEALGVSLSKAYRIIKMLNEELNSRGYITIPGKVSKKYFADRFYEGDELIKPQNGALEEGKIS